MTTTESRPESRPEIGSVGRGQAPEDVALLAEDITGLVKVAADSSIRLSAWAAVGGLRAARRIVAAIAEPAQAPELIEDFRTTTASITHAVMGEGDTWVRRAGESNPIVNAVLGAVDAIAPVVPVVPDPPHSGRAARSAAGAATPVEDDDAVRDHARRLLQRSRDVHDRDTPHPAYLTIVKQLAPDELRILLLVLRDGPQPLVDVRPGGLGASTASPIARGLNMVGAMAGARYIARVPSYLHNLERLGLLEVSNEVLRDPVQYSVLEAQPDVLAHLHANRRAKVLRRSLRLTPFGDEFLSAGLGMGEQPAVHLDEDPLGHEPVPEEALPDEVLAAEVLEPPTEGVVTPEAAALLLADADQEKAQPRGVAYQGL